MLTQLERDRHREGELLRAGLDRYVRLCRRDPALHRHRARHRLRRRNELAALADHDSAPEGAAGGPSENGRLRLRVIERGAESLLASACGIRYFEVEPARRVHPGSDGDAEETAGIGDLGAADGDVVRDLIAGDARSEEHTSELQSR